MRLRDVARPLAGSDDEVQGDGHVLVGAAGKGLQVPDDLRPVRRAGMDAQPLDGETFEQDIGQAGKLNEVVQRQFSGLGADPLQKEAQVRRQSAVVVESGRVCSHGNGKLHGTALGFVPMGHKVDDLPTDLGLHRRLKLPRACRFALGNGVRRCGTEADRPKRT